MAAHSEKLEREARRTRGQLTATIEQLRFRMTPGQLIDQMFDYTREGPAAEFLRNLGREVRENPVPLVLIGIGVAWLMLASSRTSRSVVASTAAAAEKGAEALATAAEAAARKTREWLPGGRTETAVSAEQPSDRSPIVAISDYDEATDARAVPELEPVHGNR
jgi:Protein of unknown function (DUF3618)